MRWSELENVHVKELKTLMMLASDPKMRMVLRKKDFYKKLQFGDILFTLNLTGTRRIQARTIMRVTKSRISHVSMYLEKGKMIEIDNAHGVDFEKLMDMKEQILVVLRADLSRRQKTRLKKIVRRLMEPKLRFSKRGIVGYFLYHTMGFFPRWLNTKKNYFCSEFVYECYLKSGCKLGQHIRSEFVSPIYLFESKKLHVVAMLDGVHGIHFNRKTYDSNKKIHMDAKKILVKMMKQ